MNEKKTDMKKVIRNKSGRLLCYLFLITAVFASLFPFYWMIVCSTNSNPDILQKRLTFGTYFVENFKNLVNSVTIAQGFWNSLITSVCGCLLMLIVCSMAGYGFAKYKSPGKERAYKILMVSMMIPFSSIMIPLFRMMSSMSLINSLVALVIPSIASVFLTFFFRQNFSGFPYETLEAARIDGANEYRIFFNIVVPSMKSTYAAGAIWAFMRIWNDFLWPLLVIQTPPKQTLPLIISGMNAAYYIDYGPIMVAILIATLPLIVIFLTLQEQFVSGIVGASK